MHWHWLSLVRLWAIFIRSTHIHTHLALYYIECCSFFLHDIRISGFLCIIIPINHSFSCLNSFSLSFALSLHNVLVILSCILCSCVYLFCSTPFRSVLKLWCGNRVWAEHWLYEESAYEINLCKMNEWNCIKSHKVTCTRTHTHSQTRIQFKTKRNSKFSFF